MKGCRPRRIAAAVNGAMRETLLLKELMVCGAADGLQLYAQILLGS